MADKCRTGQSRSHSATEASGSRSATVGLRQWAFGRVRCCATPFDKCSLIDASDFEGLEVEGDQDSEVRSPAAAAIDQIAEDLIASDRAACGAGGHVLILNLVDGLADPRICTRAEKRKRGRTTAEL